MLELCGPWTDRQAQETGERIYTVVLIRKIENRVLIKLKPFGVLISTILMRALPLFIPAEHCHLRCSLFSAFTKRFLDKILPYFLSRGLEQQSYLRTATLLFLPLNSNSLNDYTFIWLYVVSVLVLFQ